MEQMNDQNFELDNGSRSYNNAEIKKREMFDLIDNFSKPNAANFEKQSKTYNSHTSNENIESYKKPQHKGENYWNDWFGRPGAGAPSWTNYKQNLDKMLEPTSKEIFYHNQPNVPTIYAQSNKSPRKPKSNHYNNYELV